METISLSFFDWSDEGVILLLFGQCRSEKTAAEIKISQLPRVTSNKGNYRRYKPTVLVGL